MQLRVCWKHRLKIALNHALFVLRAQGLSDCVLHVYVCSHTLSSSTDPQFLNSFLGYSVYFWIDLCCCGVPAVRNMRRNTLFLCALGLAVPLGVRHRECADGSVLMHRVISLLPVSFLSFSVLRGPLGLVRPPQPLRTEQNRDLTSLSYSCTACYWMVIMKECWRNICIVVQDKYDKQ